MVADFPAGTRVRIVGPEILAGFQRPQWQLHHPIADEQLPYASTSTIVTNVFYYHGGDELYELQDVPGLWHEACLEVAP